MPIPRIIKETFNRSLIWSYRNSVLPIFNVIRATVPSQKSNKIARLQKGMNQIEFKELVSDKNPRIVKNSEVVVI